MNNLRNRYYLIFAIFFILRISVLSQEFEKSSLIELPGMNYGFELFQTEIWISDSSYICWINHLDLTYTIYLQNISPIVRVPIILYSSNNESSNPTIAYGSDGGIFIVWQSKINNTWQLLGRTYNIGKLSEIEQITNSGYNNISPSLSHLRLVWISGGNLLVKTTENLGDEPYTLDSINCSNPTINKWNPKNYTEILYEKGDSLNKQIYQAIQRRGYPPNQLVWETSKVDKHSHSINPRFGIERNITFQTQIDGFWKTCYSFWGDSLIVSINNNYNRENPDIFTYPIPTKRTSQETPFYLAFDSDSLLNNREVFIKPIIYFEQDSIINISSMEGDDTHPSFLRFWREGKAYLAIIWEHNENDNSSIWWAVTEFHIIISNVKTHGYINQFSLSQNYPNPFNPTTAIKYSIPNVAANFKQYVILTVYDVLGREVVTIVNQQQKPGNYQIDFDGSKLASGVYYYKLSVGKYQNVKKMILLK